MDEVKLGFIGTGGIARSHMKRLQEVPEAKIDASSSPSPLTTNPLLVKTVFAPTLRIASLRSSTIAPESLVNPCTSMSKRNDEPARRAIFP